MYFASLSQSISGFVMTSWEIFCQAVASVAAEQTETAARGFSDKSFTCLHS